MTLALYGKSRRRQGGLLLVGLLAVLVAVLAGVATYTAAFAHHTTHQIQTNCSQGTWSYSADFFGGGSSGTPRRVEIYRNDVLVKTQDFTGLEDVNDFYTDSGQLGQGVSVTFRVEMYSGTGFSTNKDNEEPNDVSVQGKGPCDEVVISVGTCAASPSSGFTYHFLVPNGISNGSGGTLSVTFKYDSGAAEPVIQQAETSDSNSHPDWHVFIPFNGHGSITILSAVASGGGVWDGNGEETVSSTQCGETPPKLKVIKAVPGKDGQDFAFTVDGSEGQVLSANDASFNLDDDDNNALPNFNDIVLPLVTGSSDSYTISEGALPSGWQFDSVSCTGGSPVPGARAVALTLANGDDVTCTFNNSKIVNRTLKVCKAVDWNLDGNNDGGQFTITVSGATPFAPTVYELDSHNPECQTYTVPHGTSVTISETGFPTGWANATGYPWIELSPGADPGPGTSVTVTVGDESCGPNLSGNVTGYDCKVTIHNKKGTLQPKVGLDKDDDGEGTYEIGDSFNFRLKFKVSNGPTTQATIAKDTIPSQFTVGDVTTGQPAGISCSKVGQDVTCTLAAGAANGTHTALIPVTVAQGATCGPVTNSAEITADSPHRDPDDYTGDEEVTIPCPQTITLTLRVCKLIDAASGDTAEPFTITVSDKDPFTPSITEAGEAGKLCKDYSYEVPVNEPTVDVTVNETEPSGWNQPEYTTKDQGSSETDPDPLPDAGVTISLGQGTCEAVGSSQTSQVQSVVVDVNPDCTVTIINKVNKGEIFIGKDDSQTAPANAVGGATFRLTLGDLDLCVTDGVNPAVANPAVPECANATWVPDMALGAVGTAKVTGLMLGTWHVFEVLEPVGYGPDTCGGERIAPLTATAKSWSIAGPGCTAASPGWTAFHNLRLDREIEIEKHFVETGGYVAGAGDVPTFTLNDPDYSDVTFASACEPLANGAPNHLAWTCTVPYDWDGTVTEEPAEGWEEVTCQEPESFISQVTGLVASLTQFQARQSSWEFCNVPFAEVKVQKVFVGDFTGYPAFTFTEDLPDPVDNAGPAANTTVSVYDTQVLLGTYSVSEDQALTEQEGCFGDNAEGYFTHVSVAKNGATIVPKGEGSSASIPATAPGDQVTVTFYNTRCELAASPIVIIEKFADPAGNRSGTTSISGFQIAVYLDGVQLDGDLGTAGVQPFTSNGGPIVLAGLDPATVTAVEVNPNTGGWKFTGAKTDLGDDGAFEKSVAGQPAAEAITYDDILRFNFYNQPRVNIEVNKTEISLATPAGAPGNGWSFTLTGCGITPQVAVTGVNGKATFSNLPPAVGCSYTVTETVKSGWSAINPVQVTAPTAAGQTVALGFTNVKIEVCTNCVTIVTPTPTPTTPTVTPEPSETPETPGPSETPETPSVTPETTTPGPTEDTAGARTPGPGQTPIAPSTGNGFMGTGAAGANMLLALVGLLALSLGTTILALGRKSSRR